MKIYKKTNPKMCLLEPDIQVNTRKDSNRGNIPTPLQGHIGHSQINI